MYNVSTFGDLPRPRPSERKGVEYLFVQAQKSIFDLSEIFFIHHTNSVG
jgi:hypothetical protein